MKPTTVFGLGISGTFWGIIALTRLVFENVIKKPKKVGKKPETKLKLRDIGVIMSAHNEELGIRQSLQSLKKSLRKKQIYVASDGSKDKTYRRARAEGCHVTNLAPGRGKARALVYLIKRYRLYEKYKLIFILDADTRVDNRFFDKALEMFEDPSISVVFSGSKIIWPNHFIPRLSLYYVAYRDRLIRLLTYFYIYAQTWKYTNVNYVIPGFCTIYRTKVLKKLEIDTPGILIEDFNLGFQFHKKKLGKIGFDHTIRSTEQYPDNLSDYFKQVRRWNIGFYQTVRKHGMWPSFFWLSLLIFSLEVSIQSLFVLFLPFIVLLFISTLFSDVHPFLKTTSQLFYQLKLDRGFTFPGIFLGMFLIDYVFTVIVALIYKRPQYLFYGLFFFLMHFITSIILLSSVYPGFFKSSSGRWISPTRRIVEPIDYTTDKGQTA